MAATATVLFAEAPVAIAAVTGILAWGATSVPGLARVRAARAERGAAQARTAERRRDVVGDRLEPWHQRRDAARLLQGRFARACDRCRPGPLRDRLEGMQPDIDEAQHRIDALVDLGMELEEALADERAPQGTPAGGRSGGARSRSSRRERRALEVQRDAVERRARDIDASLTAAVAIAFELALDSIDAGASAGIDDLVGELETLSQALSELQGQSNPPA